MTLHLVQSTTPACLGCIMCGLAGPVRFVGVRECTNGRSKEEEREGAKRRKRKQGGSKGRKQRWRPAVSMHVFGDLIAKNCPAQRTHTEAGNEVLWHDFGQQNWGGGDGQKRAKSHVSIAKDTESRGSARKTPIFGQISDLIRIATRMPEW